MSTNPIEHLHRNATDLKIKLVKYAKGYGWEITVEGEQENEEALEQLLGRIDDSLAKQWGKGEG